jgi:hypothetical protein
VLVSANNFKQITTLSFYAGAVDSHEENVVLESAHARQEIVTSATGTPLPEAQTSAAVTAQRSAAFPNRTDLIDPLRQVPGVFVVRQGEYGGLASLFIRGGNADSNQVNLDGVGIGDIGGAFDFSNLSTAGIADFEVFPAPSTWERFAAAPRFRRCFMRGMPAPLPPFATGRRPAVPMASSITTAALTPFRATTPSRWMSSTTIQRARTWATRSLRRPSFG